MIAVRAAHVGDIEEMLVMGSAMHDESPRFRGHDYRPDKLAELAERLMAMPGGIVIVADDGAHLVGMAVGMVAEHWASSIKVASDLVVYVRPENRGGPAFVRLMAAFEAWAVNAGADEIQLGVGTEVEPERTAQMLARWSYRQSGIGMVKNVRAGCVGAAAAG